MSLTPQHHLLDENHRIKVNFAQTEDFPVDLYLLVDLSKSMQNHKEKLSNLADLLKNTMKEITSNFRIGFGSFNSVDNENGADYEYHNVMPLGADLNLFSVSWFLKLFLHNFF
jgi:hypothetical protein